MKLRPEVLRKKLDQQVDAIMLDMAKQEQPNKRGFEFRISGLPFCPIRALLYKEISHESFNMDFYTSIGTAVHETNQKWLTLGNFRGKIFACWKAKETGEVVGPCFYDDIPQSWSNYTIEYEEITINYKGLSGHVDLIVEILPGMFIVMDWKTTDLGGKKRRFPLWQNEYPASRSSIIQISSYATLLREVFGLNVVAWCLIYVDRGKVIATKDDFHKILRPWTKKKHVKHLALIDKACANNKRLQRLQKLLNKSDDYSPVAVEALKDIVKHRPCVDEESYDEWMDYKFSKWDTDKKVGKGTKDGACVHKPHCLNGSKACYKSVLAKL